MRRGPRCNAELRRVARTILQRKRRSAAAPQTNESFARLIPGKAHGGLIAVGERDPVRRTRLDARENGAVLGHEPDTWRIKTLDSYARQDRVEPGPKHRIQLRAAAERGVDEGELIAAAPFLSMLHSPTHDQSEANAKTIPPRAHRVEAGAIRLAVARQIERPGSPIPRRRRVRDRIGRGGRSDVRRPSAVRLASGAVEHTGHHDSPGQRASEEYQIRTRECKLVATPSWTNEHHGNYD